MNSKLLIFVGLFVILCSGGISDCREIQSKNSHCYYEDGDQEPKLLNVEWLSASKINVTVQSPTKDPVCNDTLTFAPETIGHFSFDDHNGHRFKFKTQQPNADWVNGYNFEITDLYNVCNGFIPEHVGQNPYSYVVDYDPKKEPSKKHKSYYINYQTMDSKMCEDCKKYDWCNSCNAKWFRRNFKNWTSGNNDIDKFIQHTQLSANECYEVLEWIPCDRFYDIKYIAKGGFGRVYRANWIDGYIGYWDNENKNWKRWDSSMEVALKSLNNSKNVTLAFINEITSHHKINENASIIRLYGITQDPDTKNYMIVLDYAENGSLRNYLDINYDKLDWKTKIYDLWLIACGLDEIHTNELIHRDLHVGNILYNDFACITDMGLSKPADCNALENTKNSVYGVLPYIAPEILRGQNYTKAADIYSLGIIMYEVISGLPPYHDVSHNENLAMKICQGLRPRFNIKVPQLIVHLIKRFLDANPLNRPSALEVKVILFQWWHELDTEEEEINGTELQKQIKEADEFNNKLQANNNVPSTSLLYETHTGAIYTSRFLNFNRLPESKNSDDYYNQYDNIISIKCSETLQIDISQLKINDDQNNESKDEYYLP
ncbi:kinase-like domain-containing protein [Glomus cerebriforme]|uniref:Kinase-like domain-containing protein n=1 Tax=Glomus cerebriforme TaxID=658196 RepID=A0A397TKC8_9GLOM|nr:kinase-like domain-containing protein [Glomus cerebriforme]